jgi:hypothetical protein
MRRDLLLDFELELRHSGGQLELRKVEVSCHLGRRGQDLQIDGAAIGLVLLGHDDGRGGEGNRGKEKAKEGKERRGGVGRQLGTAQGKKERSERDGER